MAWLLTALRRLRDERLQTVGVALLIFVTALAAALTPRVLDWLADTTLATEIRAASGPSKQIQLVDERRIAWTTDAFEHVAQRGAALEADMPATVRNLFVDRSVVVESPRWSVVAPGKPRSTVRFRVQPGAAERVRIVEGRLPVGDAGTVDIPARQAGQTREVAAFEAALSVTSAARLRLEVGETIALAADVDDRMASGHLDDAAALVIVGIYEVADLADPFWIDDTALATPAVREISSENAFYDATVLLGDAAYAPLMFSTAPTELPMRYTWRYFVDPDRFEGETADALLADLRRLEAQYPASIGPATYVNPTATMRTGLRRLVEAQRAGWHAAESALTVAAIGPVVVAAAAVALVALLASQRRRAALALARGRGASVVQVAAAILVEGLLIAVPAAIVAVGIASAVLPDGPPLATVGAAALVAGLAMGLLLAVSFPRQGRDRDGWRASGGARQDGTTSTSRSRAPGDRARRGWHGAAPRPRCPGRQQRRGARVRGPVHCRGAGACRGRGRPDRDPTVPPADAPARRGRIDPS
jgi:putative ABC transport system permease protein